MESSWVCSLNSWLNSTLSGSTSGGIFASIVDIILLIAFLNGIIWLISFVYRMNHDLIRHFIRPRIQKRNRLYLKYSKADQGADGERSWAVVTGGSDGIGLAMAKELAVESLFNICIVGRNESKM